MDKQKILNDFIEYIEPTSGLIQPNRKEVAPSDNGLLFTGESLIVLKELGIQSVNLEKFFYDQFNKRQKELGLYSRNPWNCPINQQDDYTALAAYDSNIASNIYDYGRRNFWYFNDQKHYPGSHHEKGFFWEAWFGRWIYFPSFIKLAAGYSPSLWNIFVLSLSFLISARDLKSQDGYMLGWIRAYSLKGKSKIIDWSIRHFLNKFKAVYPLGPKQCFSAYSTFPDHPLSKYWDDFIK